MFPESVLYDEDTLEQAVKNLITFKADMGGTEILSPITSILSSEQDPMLPR
jgi:hypothetical protein